MNIKKLATSPVLWGFVITGIFYGILHGFRSVVPEGMTRYFCGHEIEYVETLMFCVGFCALWKRVLDVRFQSLWIAKQEAAPETFFGKRPKSGNLPEEAEGMIRRLLEIPEKIRNGYFITRLKSALGFVERNQSAVGFEDELKYLSDLDANRMSQGYSFIRVIIWAIPILGFLGTVMGITLAIGNLGGAGEMEKTLPKMIASLSLAFDTTALALSFSIVLMFFQFFVEKTESRLLDRVDVQVHRELSGRFEQHANTPEGLVSAVRTQGDALLQLLETQTRRQAEIWEKTFQQAGQEWLARMQTLGGSVSGVVQKSFEDSTNRLVAQATAGVGSVVSTEVTKALRETLSVQWSTQISELKSTQAAAIQQTESLRVALNQNEKTLQAYAGGIVRVGEGFQNSAEKLDMAVTQMTQVVRGVSELAASMEQISKMENVLTQNLSTLQGARNFEHTVGQLAAAASELTRWLETVRGGNQTKTDTQA